MKIEIYKCDRCGATYDPVDDILFNLDDFETVIQIDKIYFKDSKEHKYKVDLCPKCLAEVKTWVGDPTYTLAEPSKTNNSDSQEVDLNEDL